MECHRFESVFKRIEDVIKKYGDAPTIGESLETSFIKIMHALEHMDKTIEDAKNP